MATTVEELEVLIKANTASLKSGLDQVKKQMRVLQKATNSSSKGMSTGMIAAGTVIGNIATKVIGAAFNTIAGEMDGAITRLDTLNNYSRVMSNLGISSEDAEKSITVLNEGILGLPTSLDAAAQATQRLTAVNGNIAASTDMFLALNNAILAGGASTQLQETALEQLTQAYSKGKADAMEWRAMLSAMPAQMNQVAKAMGYTSAALGGDLQTALTNGEVTMNDFMFTIMKLNEEGVDGFQSFAEQAKNATGGVQTSMSNMKISIQRALANIGDAIGQSNIAGFFNKIASVIDTVGIYIAGFVKVIKEAVAWVSVLFGGSGSTGDLVKATNSAAQNTSSLAAGASDTASGLNDATSAAKKLKGQLAGFDEMNVLTEKDTSSSGGSSSGSSGGSTAITDYDWDSDGLTDGIDKVTEAAEKIKAAFTNMLAGLESSFPKTINKLKSLFSKLGNIGSNTAKFIGNTWEKMGPQISEGFGSAISSLGGLLDSFWAASWSPMEGFFNGFADRWASIGQVAVTGMGVLTNSILTTVAQVSDQIKAPFDALSAHLAQAGTSMGILVGGIFTQFTVAFATHASGIQKNFLSFTQSIADTLTIFADLGGQIWSDFCASLNNMWTEYGGYICDGIAGAVENIIGTFQRIYDKILAPIINPFLRTLKDTWDNHIQGLVDKVTELIGKLAAGATDIYNKFISPIVNFLVDTLAPVFVGVGNTIGSIFNNVLGTISGVVDSILDVLGGLIDFISGVFTLNWSKAWNGVKNIFSSIASGLGNIFKSPINFIIDIVNGFISGLNAIKIPDWVPGVGGYGIDIPSIPKLATGGVVTAPTTALIGEAGREAVLPLDRNTGWMDELAEKIGAAGSGQPIHITIHVGDDRLVDKVIDGINSASGLRNRPVIHV